MGRGGPLSASAAVRQETQTSAWAWHARSRTRVISADGSHRVSQARALSPVSNLYPPCYAYAFLNLHPPFRKPHRPPAAKSGPVNVRPPCALMGFLLFCCSLFSSSRPFILLPQNTLTLVSSHLTPRPSLRRLSSDPLTPPRAVRCRLLQHRFWLNS